MSQLPDRPTENRAATTRSLKEQMAVGVAWMTAARLGVQSLGIVSTLILARLLTPEDFGLIALAMSVVMLLETLGQFGFEIPLIQRRDTSRDDFDTAWTLNILTAGVLGGCIVAAAPFAARFYAEPRVEAILYWIALGHFLFAFQNIGTVMYRKELNFRRDFQLQIAQKLAMLAVAIPLAFFWRSYWAMVAGMVAGKVAAMVVSYWFLPYRPRFCLRSWRQLLSFSKWLQLNGVLLYFRDRGYILVMGRILDASSVGLFTLADDIASLPSTSLVAPLNRAVFPGFARISNDVARLRDGYKSMLGLIALVALPAAVGLAAVSDLVVTVALGAKWQAAAPLLALLALAGASRTLTASTVSMQYALGQPHFQTVTTGIQAITLLPLVTAGVLYDGVMGAAWAYFLHSALVFVPASYGLLLRQTPIRVSDIWEPLWRPGVAAAAMFAVVYPLALAWAVPESLAALPRLLLLVALGVVTYVCSLAVLWLMSGRPNGAERVVLTRARSALNQRRRSTRPL